ncbi:glutamate--tRNA ligase [Candidatus Margulisiibacteriota bacterium]
MTKEIRTRFAPSPTGYLHVGGARTALYNWLWARHNKGKFILRVEDTDQERSTDESVQNIFNDMKWLGLDWDEGPFHQSDRKEIYEEHFNILKEKNKIYEKEGAWVFKMPNEDDSFVFRRSDGSFLYNFCCVIDDHLMNITHIIRGEDHRPNYPKQEALCKAFGWEMPRVTHVSLLVGQDKKPLSKRHGEVAIEAFKAKGILPEAIDNYLLRLGWSCGDQEIFTIDEMIEKFNLEKTRNSPALFDEEKLQWLNGVFMRQKSVEELKQEIQKKEPEFLTLEQADEIIKIIQEKISSWDELFLQIKPFIADTIEPNKEKLDELFQDENIKNAFQELIEKLKNTNWELETIEKTIRDFAEEKNIKVGKLLQSIRHSCFNLKVTPSIFSIIYYLGKNKTITRMKHAIK